MLWMHLVIRPTSKSENSYCLIWLTLYRWPAGNASECLVVWRQHHCPVECMSEVLTWLMALAMMTSSCSCSPRCEQCSSCFPVTGKMRCLSSQSSRILSSRFFFDRPLDRCPCVYSHVVVTLEISSCPYGSHDQNMSVFGLATSQQCHFLLIVLSVCPPFFYPS